MSSDTLAMSGDLADIDVLQSHGEKALTTLTQLWRSLPRVDSDAGRHLADEVVAARKAIESLVRAACASHMRLADSVKLYEPLPFGGGGNVRAPPGGGSPDHHGQQRGVSTFSGYSLGAGSRLQSASPDDEHYSPADAVRAAAAGHISSVTKSSIFDPDSEEVGGGAAARASRGRYDAVGYDDYDPDSPERKCFRSEIRLPGVPQIIFDDPSLGAQADALSDNGATPLSRLSLMVQFAERREQMWRNHAAHLHARNDREELAEMEVRERYEIALHCAETRERLISSFYCLAASDVFGDDGTGSSASGGSKRQRSSQRRRAERQQMLDGLRETLRSGSASSFEPASPAAAAEASAEQKHRALLAKCATMEQERQKLVDEMAKLSSEVTRLSVENSTLTKKAAEVPVGPSPDLAQLTGELAELRKQMQAQQERSRSMSRTASPAVEGGGIAAITMISPATPITVTNSRAAAATQQQQQQQQPKAGSVASPPPKAPGQTISMTEAIKAAAAAKQRGGAQEESKSGGGGNESKPAVAKRALGPGHNPAAWIFGSVYDTKKGGGSGAAAEPHTLGKYGDDTFIPSPVVRAANLYFKKSGQQQQQDKKRGGARRKVVGGARRRYPSDADGSSGDESSSGSTSGYSSSSGSTRSSLLNSLEQEHARQRREELRRQGIILADDDDAENGSKDPEMQAVERKNRETLERLKYQLLHGGSAAPDPSATAGAPRSPIVVLGQGSGFGAPRRGSPVRAQQQQHLASGAFGAPKVNKSATSASAAVPAVQGKQQQQQPSSIAAAAKPKPKPKAKGGSSSFAGGSSLAAASAPGPQSQPKPQRVPAEGGKKALLGHLAWEYRSGRRSPHGAAGARTPPAPSLNLVTLAASEEVVRLEAEDSEGEGVANKKNDNSARRAVSASSNGNSKHEIQLRSAGRPSALEALAASPERQSPPRTAGAAAAAAPRSAKLPAAHTARPAATKRPAAKPSASAARAPAASSPGTSASPLREAFDAAQLGCLEATERAERQQLYGEAAVYFTQRAALMDKEPVEWFSPLSARGQEAAAAAAVVAAANEAEDGFEY